MEKLLLPPQMSPTNKKVQEECNRRQILVNVLTLRTCDFIYRYRNQRELKIGISTNGKSTQQNVYEV